MLTMDDIEEEHLDEPTWRNNSDTTETPRIAADGAILVEDLLKRCHDLLNELAQFRTFLVESKKQIAVEIRQFHNSVRSELKSLEKVQILHQRFDIRTC